MVSENQLQGRFVFNCMQIGIVSFCEGGAESKEVSKKAARLEIETFVGDKRRQISAT